MRIKNNSLAFVVSVSDLDATAFATSRQVALAVGHMFAFEQC